MFHNSFYALTLVQFFYLPFEFILFASNLSSAGKVNPKMFVFSRETRRSRCQREGIALFS